MSSSHAEFETTGSGTIGPAPSPFPTGHLDSQMGHATAFAAVIRGFLARHAREEFADTFQFNTGF